ncbi:MAG: divalent metal cation transporter [Bacteroidia bacterium]|nr:MAG: divalent metal cation transporter [Bacteroidia bacterium]
MLRYLGPGILLAGAAIGGSHLVASTQAGAHYGWSLLGILLLVNLFKYPFFRYGQRYTAATGESILEAYVKLGRGYLFLFFLLNLFTGMANIAGVSMITGSLATNFGVSGVSVPVLSGIFMLTSMLIVMLGGFSLLRRFGKIIVAVLGLSTVVAVIISLISGPAGDPAYAGESPWTMASFGFVIMFMGWMPAPIEASVWPSLWMKSQQKLQKKSFVMREAMTDFHAGYYASVFFALVFLVLGKMLIYGTGTVLSPQGTVFARQLIDLYSIAIGEWSRPLIVVVAFSAMFSTTLTTIDAYPRALANSTRLLFPIAENRFRAVHVFWIISGVAGSFLLIQYFVDQLGDMLSLAMILSFLAAPVFAFLNYRIMFLDNVPEMFRPKPWEKTLSVAGMFFLIGFGLVFILWYFFS